LGAGVMALRETEAREPSELIGGTRISAPLSLPLAVLARRE